MSTNDPNKPVISFNEDEALQLLAGTTQLLCVIQRGTKRWDEVTAIGNKLMGFIKEASKSHRQTKKGDHDGE